MRTVARSVIILLLLIAVLAAWFVVGKLGPGNVPTESARVSVVIRNHDEQPRCVRVHSKSKHISVDEPSAKIGEFDTIYRIPPQGTLGFTGKTDGFYDGIWLSVCGCPTDERGGLRPPFGGMIEVRTGSWEMIIEANGPRLIELPDPVPVPE